MKKILYLICFLFAASFSANAQQGTLNLNIPNSTNAVFASSTNFNPGAARALPDGTHGARIYVDFTGTDATTNGNYTVYLQTGRGIQASNFWDNATNSNVKIVVPCQGVTNSGSLWFNLVGVQSIRVGRQENTSLGIATNPVITVVIPQPAQYPR